MMPDLPNVGWERDIESFREFFENPAFRTDGLKVYPTLVIRGTGLYELWKAGLYKNYEPVQLIDLVARILALVPPWVWDASTQTIHLRSDQDICRWPLSSPAELGGLSIYHKK